MNYILPLGLTAEEENILSGMNTTCFEGMDYHEGIKEVYDFISIQEGLFKNVVVSFGGNKVVVQRIIGV